jgi:hypothetical protein
VFSLALLPEYHCRINVLRQLQYIDSTSTVQLKVSSSAVQLTVGASIKQCSGSVTFWYHANPDLRIRIIEKMDPDPAIFFRGVRNTRITSFFLLLFAFYLPFVYINQFLN